MLTLVGEAIQPLFGAMVWLQIPFGVGGFCGWLPSCRQIRFGSLVGHRPGPLAATPPFQLQVDRVTRGPALAFAEAGLGRYP
jgi:hypothetical protein